MNQEILDVLAKNLPAMQMEVLRVELQKAHLVDDLQDSIKNRDQRITKLQDELQEAKQLNMRIDSLQAKERELEKKERDLEMEKLKEQLKSKDAVIVAITDLAKTAFRNPTIMRYSSGQEPAGNGSMSTLCTNRTETITQD